MLLMWPFKAVKLLSLYVVIPCYTHLVSISIGIYTPKQNINIHIVRFSTFSVVLTVLLKQLPSFYNNKTISYQSNIYLQKVCQEKFWVGHPLLDRMFIYKIYSHPQTWNRENSQCPQSIPSFELQLKMVLKWNLNSIPPPLTSPEYPKQV